MGETVRLSGWVHRIRDHGGVLFIDLRDHYGVTQVLCDPDSPVFNEVENVRSEWCIRIDGNVKARDGDLINPKISTGEIEVFIRDMEVLGASEELPLIVFGDQETVVAAQGTLEQDTDRIGQMVRGHAVGVKRLKGIVIAAHLKRASCIERVQGRHESRQNAPVYEENPQRR